VVFAKVPLLDVSRGVQREPVRGDYVACEVVATTGISLIAVPIALTTLADWAERHTQWTDRAFWPGGPPPATATERLRDALRNAPPIEEM